MDSNLPLIIPGILETNWEEIEKKINLVAPFAKTIHIDLIDGVFAPTKTFMDPAPFAKYTKNIEFEVHMMVDEPINYLEKFADAGFRRFIGHIEKMSDQVEFVARAQILGEVGLGIDSPTSVEEIKVPVTDLDLLLVMTVKAGESGQEFDKVDLSKIENMKDNFFIPLEVDGGINPETLIEAKNYGVSRFVATSYIFNGEARKNFDELNSVLKGGGE